MRRAIILCLEHEQKGWISIYQENEKGMVQRNAGIQIGRSGDAVCDFNMGA